MRPDIDRDSAPDGVRAAPATRSADPVRPDAQQPNTLQLWEEQVSFDRERVETGRVRVRVATHQHEQTVEVPLTRETVEVERVAIGREIESIPPRRQEGDVTIVPVVEEVVVVQRKLVLKEELHLRLVRTTEQHRETVSLRRQEAVVERLAAERASGTQTSGEPRTD